MTLVYGLIQTYDTMHFEQKTDETIIFSSKFQKLFLLINKLNNSFNYSFLAFDD
jgi:hypothetical protein